MPERRYGALWDRKGTPVIESLVEACAAVAERIEVEALGSPIAQDTARRIRLAILALGEKPR